MTLFINNLPPHATQVDLLELFEEFGAVKHIFLPSDWHAKGLRFAFVEMAIKQQEATAINELIGSKWMGNQLQISELKKQARQNHHDGSVEISF